MIKKIFLVTSIIVILFTSNVFAYDKNFVTEYIDYVKMLNSIDKPENNKSSKGLKDEFIMIADFETEDFEDNTNNETSVNDNQIDSADIPIKEFYIIVVYALGCISGFLMSGFLLKWFQK